MTSLETVRMVAAREFRERGKSRAYLISSAVTLGIILAMVVIPAVLSGRGRTFTVGVLGEGNGPILAAAEALTADDEFPTTIETVSFDDRDEASTALEEGEVDAVLVDGRELLVTTTGGFGGSDLERLLQQAASTRRIQELLTTGGAAADVVEILTAEALEVVPLRGERGEEAARRGIIAYGGLVLMYIAILSYGAWLLTGVTEEKSNRVVEVLLATMKPWQLLAGKMVGIGLLGILQFVVTLITATVAIRVTDLFDFPEIPVDLLLSMVLWFLLGYGLYSVAYGAAGSLVSRAEDAQTAAFPMTMVAVVGFFVSFRALADPSSASAVAMTFIPPVAPFVVPVRVAFGAIPLWEHAAAVAVTVGFLAVLVRLAGRVYAGALLHYGGRLKFREAFRSAEM